MKKQKKNFNKNMNISKKKDVKIKPISKWLYWTPRILSIIFILFLMMFSLDVISLELNFWQILGGMFMHNIPALFLILVLVISWKYEIVGAIAFILAGLLYIAMLVFGSHFEWYMLSWSIIISGPAILVGVLFFLNWHYKKK